MSAAELRTRVCFNKRLSLAEGAPTIFAVQDLDRRRSQRLADAIAKFLKRAITYKGVMVQLPTMTVL